MPLYDYKCEKCGDTVEVLCSSDAEPVMCCGQPMTRQMPGPGSIKVWNYEPGMDAAASARRCGVDWD